MNHREESACRPNVTSRGWTSPMSSSNRPPFGIHATRRLRRWHRNQTRRGAALVEFAVLLPVLLLVVFGTIEAASMIFLKQALVQASYESVKILARREGTEAIAIRAANQVATGRRIENFNIQFEPSDVRSVSQGGLIRVTVSAPANANTLTGFTLAGERRVSAFAVMVKE